jgi:hypothetical protein
MAYSGKILALFAVFALVVSGLGFSSTAALADDSSAVARVALADSHKKGEAEEHADEMKMKEKHDEMSGDTKEHMEEEMKDMDKEPEKDDS